MLSNLVISFEAIVPLFGIILIGFLLKKKNIITEAEAKRFNRIVFLVCFGPVSFTNIYGADLNTALNCKLIIYSVGLLLFMYALTVALVIKIEPESKTRGAMIQALYRSNAIILGLPIVQNLFHGQDLGVAAIVISVIVPIYNVLAVLTLEVFRGGKPATGHILKSMLKNPILIGAILGIITAVFKIVLPMPVEKIVTSLSQAATPMALLLLGASFNSATVSEEKRNLTICVVGRLIVYPFAAIAGGLLLGFRGLELATLMAIFAAPCAVSSFTMAQQMDSDAELAGNCVIFTSAFSCVTMFLWIFVLKSMGVM